MAANPERPHVLINGSYFFLDTTAEEAWSGVELVLAQLRSGYNARYITPNEDNEAQSDRPSRVEGEEPQAEVESVTEDEASTRRSKPVVSDRSLMDPACKYLT